MNSAKGEIWYVPNVGVFAATRPLDDRCFTYLNESGFLDRFHVVQHQITDSEASEHLHKDFKLNQDALAQLKEINSKLANIKVAKMLRPTEAFMKPLYDELEALARDECSQKKWLQLPSIISPRTKGDMLRELVAHAFLRTVSHNGFKNIDELQYTQEDIEFIRNRLYHFIDFHINPIIAEDTTYRSKKMSKKDQAKESIIDTLSDKESEDGSGIVISVIQEISCNNSTAYNALRELRTEGRICEPSYSSYKLKDCNTCKYRDSCLSKTSDVRGS